MAFRASDPPNHLESIYSLLYSYACFPVWHLEPGELCPVAKFKEFKRRFKFKPRLKYGWFHLKLYQMFQDLSRR